MKVFVTGSEGYIGMILVRQLLQKGYDVVGLDTNYYKGCNIIDQKNNIELIERDVRDVTSNDLQSIDAVLHLAALSNDPLSLLKPELTMIINHESSVKLATLAKKSGVKKFVLGSSCSSYGINNTGIVDETSQLNPITAYAKSKVLAEWDISKLSDNKFTTVFFRSATVNGISPRFRFDLVVNNLTGVALTTGKIIVKSDGTPWRPTIHIEDDCSAFIHALEADNDLVNNKTYNVGSTDENYQIRDIANLIKKYTGCDVEFQNQDPDSRSYRVNCDKIKNELGFKIEWNLDKSVSNLVEKLKEIGLNYEEFDSRKYTRLKQIKYLIETNKLDSNLRWVS